MEQRGWSRYSFFFPSWNKPCRMSLHPSIKVFLRGISVKNEYPIISLLFTPGALSITTFQFKILKIILLHISGWEMGVNLWKGQN